MRTPKEIKTGQEGEMVGKVGSDRRILLALQRGWTDLRAGRWMRLAWAFVWT